MQRLFLFLILTQLSVLLPAQDNKQLGLKFLHSNEVDSALYYLDNALLENAYDGETLGGIALAYILKGNEKKSLHYARKARRHADYVFSDTYLAGVLAFEAKRRTLRRDIWLRQGLKHFPDDYLLLFHGGRIKRNLDERESERLLLHSAHINPNFEETHLLLGQSMYLQSENLKSILPLYYFLLLENDSKRGADAIVMIEYVLNSWGTSAQGISKTNHAGSGIECNFIPEVFVDRWDNKDIKCQWFVNQTVKLMESMASVKTTSNNALWEFYSDFFKRAVELNKSEALAWHIAYSRYPADVMEWIAGNTREYSEMIDWLVLQ